MKNKIFKSVVGKLEWKADHRGWCAWYIGDKDLWNTLYDYRNKKIKITIEEISSKRRKQ